MLLKQSIFFLIYFSFALADETTIDASSTRASTSKVQDVTEPQSTSESGEKIEPRSNISDANNVTTVSPETSNVTEVAVNVTLTSKDLLQNNATTAHVVTEVAFNVTLTPKDRLQNATTANLEESSPNSAQIQNTSSTTLEKQYEVSTKSDFETPPHYAKLSEYRYVVSVQEKASSKHLCVGTVLSKKWIITAADCLFKSNKTISASQLQIVAGVKNFTDSNGLFVNVQEYQIHPQYSSGNANNLALIQTKKALYWFWQPITKSGPVQPIRIGRIRSYSLLEAIGWKIYGTIGLLNALTYRSTAINDSSLIYAYSLSDKGACRQDSGAPLVVGKFSKVEFLVGIVAEVPTDGVNCGKSRPQAFTKLEDFGPWIQNVSGVKVY